MKSCEREFQPASFRQWLFGCFCWEVKLGAPLVLMGKMLLWWTDWRFPIGSWKVGDVVLWMGIACLVYGLIRDCWLLVQHWRKK